MRRDRGFLAYMRMFRQDTESGMSMSIISDFKEIGDLLKKAGNMDLYERIMDLRGRLVDLSQENLELKQKCQELEAAQRLREQMIFREGLYYKEGDETPFCPLCFETEGVAVHLLPRPGFTNYQCKHCRNTGLG